MSRTQINDKELPNDSSFVIFVWFPKSDHELL